MQAEAMTHRDHLRWAGWQDPTDDDVPRVPEPDPLASAQAKRAWRRHPQTLNSHRQP